LARFDKYEPKAGGFRAPLADDFTEDLSTAIGVGLDSNGRVVRGAGDSGIVGVLILTRNHRAGDIVDVMTDGDIVEFGGNPGTVYFAAAAGGAIATTGDARVGHTVEGERLVVRVMPGVGSGA
jgi:hypothetical protein